MWDPGTTFKVWKRDPHNVISLLFLLLYSIWKTEFFFKEIILHEFSSYLYGPLNKVICFKWISPRSFRKDYRGFVGYAWEALWKDQAKTEKAVFVLLEFANGQWYSKWKHTTCKCLVDLQI